MKKYEDENVLEVVKYITNVVNNELKNDKIEGIILYTLSDKINDFQIICFYNKYNVGFEREKNIIGNNVINTLKFPLFSMPNFKEEVSNGVVLFDRIGYVEAVRPFVGEKVNHDSKQLIFGESFLKELFDNIDDSKFFSSKKKKVIE